MTKKEERNQLSSEISVAIGFRINTRRKKLGFNGSEVAEQLNISPQQFYRYEKGIDKIPDYRLLEICEIIRKTPNELYGWEESTSKSEKGALQIYKSFSPSNQNLVVRFIHMLAE